MSRGPGRIERTIAELFVAHPNRAFTVADLCKHVFEADKPTLAQRGSVLRAAHAATRRGQSAWNWRATEIRRGLLVFHHCENPQRVWALQIRQAGVLWAEATILKITAKRVNVLYNGERASLDRGSLARSAARWRGVRFTTDRNGLAARIFDSIQYGGIALATSGRLRCARCSKGAAQTARELYPR
jgi:hypothetical protein